MRGSEARRGVRPRRWPGCPRRSRGGGDETCAVAGRGDQCRRRDRCHRPRGVRRADRVHDSGSSPTGSESDDGVDDARRAQERAVATSVIAMCWMGDSRSAQLPCHASLPGLRDAQAATSESIKRATAASWVRMTSPVPLARSTVTNARSFDGSSTAVSAHHCLSVCQVLVARVENRTTRR